MHVVAWSTAAIALLFCFFRRRTLVCLEWIEAFEDEAAVVAEQFMQPKHPDKENRIVVIPLNSFTLASRTLHTVHNSKDCRVNRLFARNQSKGLHKLLVAIALSMSMSNHVSSSVPGIVDSNKQQQERGSANAEENNVQIGVSRKR